MWKNKNIYFFKPMEPVFDSNTIIIDDDRLVLVDPGTESIDYFKNILETTGNSVEDVDLVFYTHGHYDHFEGTKFFPNADKIAFSPDSKVIENKTGFKLNSIEEETILNTGKNVFEVIHTPGHSKGSCCLYLPGELVICGDLVFANGSFGRTDLEGGAMEELKNSLNKLSNLDFENILPGHRDIGTKKSVFSAIENLKNFY